MKTNHKTPGYRHCGAAVGADLVMFTENAKTGWNQASQQCQREGMTLATLDETTNNYLKSLMGYSWYQNYGDHDHNYNHTRYNNNYTCPYHHNLNNNYYNNNHTHRNNYSCAYNHTPIYNNLYDYKHTYWNDDRGGKPFDTGEYYHGQSIYSCPYNHTPIYNNLYDYNHTYCNDDRGAWRVVLDAGFLRVCPIQPHFLRRICLATAVKEAQLQNCPACQ
nr:hypothetical protein BaRGS_033438 [Batillaria attramentaria]